MYKFTFIFVLLQFLSAGNTTVEKGRRMFFNTTFRPDKAQSVKKILIGFNDSIPDDSVSVYFENRDNPVAFSRDIHTAVCMDTLCRIVNITLYWEITGKYLGYSLPPGEELTKKEHFPFSESDYSRLHEILSDSSSQLGFYTPEEMHPVKSKEVKTDGITGATPPDISSWIVPEAAYTSYSLWHLTYGSTRDSMITYTKNHLLNNNLLIKLLNNTDPYSQFIALQWMEASGKFDKQFIEPTLKILHSGNFYAAGQALKVLKKFNPEMVQLQQEVIRLLDCEDFRLKSLALSFLRESDKIDDAVARELITRLNGDNYYLVNVILTLFDKKYRPDHHDQQILGELLNSKNVNIAGRAYYFLLNLPDQSPELVKKLKYYARKRG